MLTEKILNRYIQSVPRAKHTFQGTEITETCESHSKGKAPLYDSCSKVLALIDRVGPKRENEKDPKAFATCHGI
jgi:hypothetical protein